MAFIIFCNFTRIPQGYFTGSGATAQLALEIAIFLVTEHLKKS